MKTGVIMTVNATIEIDDEEYKKWCIEENDGEEYLHGFISEHFTPATLMDKEGNCKITVDTYRPEL